MRRQQPTGRKATIFRRRSGAVTVEFVVVLPILLIATLAMFEFGILMTIQQMATTAAVQGAREGAYGFDSALPFDANGPGIGDPTGNNDIADQIALIVDEYLAVHDLEVRQVGVNDNPSRANVYLLITRGGLTAERGDLNLSGTCTHSGAAPTTDEMVVTLCFPLVDPGNPNGVGNPVPDWLATFGFTLAPYRLEVTTRQPLE